MVISVLKALYLILAVFVLLNIIAWIIFGAW
jgi:hypothetical protein